MAGHPLRVVYNASALPRQPAGAGVYTRELAAALARRDDVELVVAAPPWAEIRGGTRVVSPPRGALPRTVWEQTGLRKALRDADVCHGTHMAIPLMVSTPTVATVHDLTFFRIPRRYTRAHRWYYRMLARIAARADRIIVPSAAIATATVRYLGYAPERIRVIAEAPRTSFSPASTGEMERVRHQMGLARDYILCLGTAEPGKRAVDAIRALALLETTANVDLVLAGNPGPLSGALQREAEWLGLTGRVHFTGYVRDSDLVALIIGALALVFPSLYEGFGLPPLEAMACGTPVITTNAPAMDEVLGDAALFVPLRDPEAIARCVRRLQDPRERADWSARGLAHVQRFSWQKAADETVEVYREVAR